MYNLIGSPKQVEWALRIIQGFQERHPDEELPYNPYASFWIEFRDSTLDEVRRAAPTQIYSPCTEVYPKWMRSDIEPLLRNMRKMVVWDSETSGLLKGTGKVDNPEIVDIAFVAVETGEVLLNTPIRPRDIDAYFQSCARKKFPGYPEEVYYDAPTFPEVWGTIKEIISEYHPVAYNGAEFDVPILHNNVLMWGLCWPRIRHTDAMKMFQIFMTTEETKWDNYKLEVACKIMHINQQEFGAPHTALADALVTRELLLGMRRFIDIRDYLRQVDRDDE